MQINFIQLIWGTSNFKKAHSFSYSVPGGHTHVFFQMDPWISNCSLLFPLRTNHCCEVLMLQCHCQMINNYSPLFSLRWNHCIPCSEVLMLQCHCQMINNYSPLFSLRWNHCIPRSEVLMLQCHCQMINNYSPLFS